MKSQASGLESLQHGPDTKFLTHSDQRGSGVRKAAPKNSRESKMEWHVQKFSEFMCI